MKIKTSELTGAALDWAVAKCEGVPYEYTHTTGGDYNGNSVRLQRKYSTNWSQGGPIIERKRITLDYYNHIADGDDQVHARLCRAKLKPDRTASWYAPKRGPTVLIAAMRCYVASELGDEIEVPEELCST